MPNDIDRIEPYDREPQWTVEQACEDTGHAYFGHVIGEPIHGAVGACECGSSLYTVNGELIDP